jgi:hypothetical protein
MSQPGGFRKQPGTCTKDYPVSYLDGHRLGLADEWQDREQLGGYKAAGRAKK